jgi:hypothetical protein
MPTPINTGTASVFFDDQVVATGTDDLISAQVDPSQPQVKGLSTTTTPIVTDRHMSTRMAGFDPEQFDLSESSHLMRFMTAVLGGAGIGGLRRQQIIANMSSMLSGTHFIELDGFWGKLFSLPRAPEEQLPTNDSGVPLDPSVDVTDSATWDIAHARDGRYRSRIEQLARGFAQGGTYSGMRMAARAIINAEVDIVESWLDADYSQPGAAGFVGNTWLAVQLQYGTWGAMEGHTWATLALGTSSGTQTQTPLGNRGEVVIIPGRLITEAERYQLHLVLNELAPAGTLITIADSPFTEEVPVPCRTAYADSVDWDVVSLISQQQAIDTSGQELYPNASELESARPAFGRYDGESWSMNGRIALVSAYAENAAGVQVNTIDYQTVTYADGTRHDYLPSDAMTDSRKLALARAASEGIATSYPYAEGRTA